MSFYAPRVRVPLQLLERANTGGTECQFCYTPTEFNLIPRYTNVWNFVDYPGAVFPTGLYSDPAIDVEDTASRTYMSEADAYNASCCRFNSAFLRLVN